MTWTERIAAFLATPADRRCNCAPGVCLDVDAQDLEVGVLCDECGLVMLATTIGEIVRRERPGEAR